MVDDENWLHLKYKNPWLKSLCNKDWCAWFISRCNMLISRLKHWFEMIENTSSLWKPWLKSPCNKGWCALYISWFNMFRSLAHEGHGVAVFRIRIHFCRIRILIIPYYVIFNSIIVTYKNKFHLVKPLYYCQKDILFLIKNIPIESKQ